MPDASAITIAYYARCRGTTPTNQSRAANQGDNCILSPEINRITIYYAQNSSDKFSRYYLSPAMVTFSLQAVSFQNNPDLKNLPCVNATQLQGFLGLWGGLCGI